MQQLRTYLFLQSVILCLEISPESILPKQLSLMDHRSSTTVICVATTETANGLLRNLHRQCLSVAMVKEGERRTVKELFKRHSIVGRWFTKKLAAGIKGC